MCSLSFIPREGGYYLAMNRDERITRRDVLLPAVSALGETTVVYPRDSAGGTWIAGNSAGIALALLNWNDLAADPGSKTSSRGSIIPRLVTRSTLPGLREALDKVDFQGRLPFRLIAVFPTEQIIYEWRWDMKTVKSQVYPWARRHWFSSSLSDDQAAVQRGAVCEQAWQEERSGSLSWLRGLHSSHANGPGPFSFCVHRRDVKTLSYTEIACAPEAVECRHFDGSPCEMDANLAETRILRT